MFHDIVNSGYLSDSGLPENWDMRGADAYKLGVNQFEYCLSVLSSITSHPSSTTYWFAK